MGLVVIPTGQAKPIDSGTRLARVTFYTSDGEPGGHYGSTGVRLEEGKHVAVDPSVIPYGSEVSIPGLGLYRAVDCGTAVTARTAARKAAGDDPQKASAIVIDVFCAKRETLQCMATTFPMYVEVVWRSLDVPATRPDNEGLMAKAFYVEPRIRTAQIPSKRANPNG